MKKVLLFVATMLAFATSSAPRADVIQWTLSGVTFSDGGTASGSFLYDADLQLIANFDVTTTAGSNLSGNHYVDLTGVWPPYPADAFAVVIAADINNLTNAPVLAFDFAGLLTDAGGVIALVPANAEGFCLNSSCSFASYRRSIVTGSVIGASVPEPSALALLGIGLAGLGFSRRKRAVN